MPPLLPPKRYKASATAWVVAAAVAGVSCEQKWSPSPSSPPRAGQFEGTWNATGKRSAIALGGDRRSAAIDLHGTMSLTGEGRPGVSFRADLVALTDSATGLVGRCVWTDERGDQIFSELKGEGTREHNHVTGTIIGGTGRYSGLSGSYEFSWEFMIESEDHTVNGRAVGLKGDYRMVQVPQTPVAPETGGEKR